MRGSLAPGVPHSAPGRVVGSACTRPAGRAAAGAGGGLDGWDLVRHGGDPRGRAVGGHLLAAVAALAALLLHQVEGLRVGGKVGPSARVVGGDITGRLAGGSSRSENCATASGQGRQRTPTHLGAHDLPGGGAGEGLVVLGGTREEGGLAVGGRGGGSRWVGGWGGWGVGGPVSSMAPAKRPRRGLHFAAKTRRGITGVCERVATGAAGAVPGIHSGGDAAGPHLDVVDGKHRPVDDDVAQNTRDESIRDCRQAGEQQQFCQSSRRAGQGAVPAGPSEARRAIWIAGRACSPEYVMGITIMVRKAGTASPTRSHLILTMLMTWGGGWGGMGGRFDCGTPDMLRAGLP